MTKQVPRPKKSIKILEVGVRCLVVDTNGNADATTWKVINFSSCKEILEPTENNPACDLILQWEAFFALETFYGSGCDCHTSTYH